jgi:signal transduction histidine kinase
MCEELLAREKAAAAATRQRLVVFTHDLRGRLNAISGWAEVLQGRIAGDEVSERAIETIGRNARAQAALIDELLAEMAADAPASRRAALTGRAGAARGETKR